MGTDSIVYIRTDGNSNIATGHLVRCLCVAQALESIGKSVCFLVSDDESHALLWALSATLFPGYSFSFQTKILETAVYDNLELELDELKTLLTKNVVCFDTKQTASFQSISPVIFIDSYFVTETYLDSLQNYAKIAYMDDLRSFDYNVDLIINYDVIPLSKESEYKQAYTKAATLLLGAKYTPLRRQFQNQRVSLRPQIQNILITTGGSDPFNFSETVLTYLLSQNLCFHFHVVIGRLFQNTEYLENLAKQYPHVHLHYNVSDMAALMKKCDYAISAAGTTLYELCALGIPATSFTMADNQMIMAETFAETGAVVYAGDIRDKHNFYPNGLKSNTPIVCHKKQAELVCNNIKKHLDSLLLNPHQRIAQHQAMRRQVDGNGAIKIAEVLCTL